MLLHFMKLKSGKSKLAMPPMFCNNAPAVGCFGATPLPAGVGATGESSMKPPNGSADGPPGVVTATPFDGAIGATAGVGSAKPANGSAVGGAVGASGATGLDGSAEKRSSRPAALGGTVAPNDEPNIAALLIAGAGVGLLLGAPNDEPNIAALLIAGAGLGASLLRTLAVGAIAIELLRGGGTNESDASSSATAGA